MDELFKKRNVTLEQVRKVVSKQRSKAGVLKKLGLGLGGANYRWLNSVLSRYKLDTKHFLGQGHLRGTSHDWGRKISLDKILVKNSTYLNTSALKKRLYADYLLTEVCYNCGQEPMWLDQPLTLHLDHIDGDPSNNLIENLRILCPNCHSQTKTFSGKNRCPSGGI